MWTYVFQLPSQAHTLMSNQGSVYVPLFILGESSTRVSDVFLFLQNVWEFQVFKTSIVSNKFKQKERMVEIDTFLQTLLLQKTRMNCACSSL